MQKNFIPNQGDAQALEKQAIAAYDKSTNKPAVVSALKNTLYGFLKNASELEHLLSMQYLFAGFSLKKYPEEFADYKPGDPNNKEINQLRLKQIEIIRKWDAKIMYVARQEMEHLNLVQNLFAILGEDPYLHRPNYPVLASQNPMGAPINLMPFSDKAIEIFRYWEKPDDLDLPDPFTGNLPQSILDMDRTFKGQSAFDLESTVNDAWAQLIAIIEGNTAPPMTRVSIETLYTYVNVYFYFMLTYKLIEGTNIHRIVEEHFGFNISLEPIVDGKYYEYVNDVITQILEEGEGVWGVPPPLDSHFMVYQEMLDEYAEAVAHGVGSFEPALPVAYNPTTSTNQTYHNVTTPPATDAEQQASPLFLVDNPITAQAMALFDDAYNVLCQMLFGFFADYNIDYTTGVRKPDTNAFFRTSFYPFMTMVIRPLGEMLCRLPAQASFTPNGGQIPPITAGPSFFFNVDNNASLEEIQKSYRESKNAEAFIDKFNEFSTRSFTLATSIVAAGYHMANYQAKDARDFGTRFNYLGENFKRIGQNFDCYLKGMQAPIPSENFQNFSTPYN